jgi:hypothetical protein
MSPKARQAGGIAVCAIMSMVSACAYSPPPPPPAVSSLTQNFSLVDPLGNRAGTLILEPVGNGVIYDGSGQVIGTVVPPVPPN